MAVKKAKNKNRTIKKSSVSGSKKKPHRVAKKAVGSKKTAAIAPKAHAKAHEPKEANLSVFDLKGKAHETLVLDALFQGPVNADVVYQAIIMYRAGEREGTAATKTRGEVSGGGKKPWKQKGTGRARHGSNRSPIWRSGGTVFGPHPRDYSYAIPLQLKRRAVAEVMKEKVLSGKLMLVNRLDVQAPKTKLAVEILDVFKLEKPLFVVEKKSENLLRAVRNVPAISVKTAEEVNALDVAMHRECLMEKGAYAGLLKRLKS